jgi:D-tyrosyl-tRNA(Tyr) deacylase
MKAVIQRVRNASVSINDTVKGSIGRGLVVLVGIAKDDTGEQALLLADKVRLLRIFEDENGKLNHSLEDIGGEALVISQFTLYADTGKGRRPSFTDAAPFNDAMELYQHFVQRLKQSGIRVETGEFGERMLVAINNEGPVTIILETEREKEA